MWYINYKTNEGVTTMRKELLKGLSEEQIKKVEACKSSDEILALAKAEGVELNEEQLAAVSGGGCFDPDWLCPFCGHTDGKKKSKQIDENGNEYIQIKCKSCGATFREGENGRLL